MSTCNSATAEPRQLSLRLPRLKSIVLAAAVLFVAPAGSAGLVDDDFDVDAPLPERQVKLTQAVIYHMVFGNCADEAAAGTRLESLLRKKAAAADLIYDLTEAQRNKLELAGRGDIKRLLDRVRDVETQSQAGTGDDVDYDALLAQIASLKLCLKSEFLEDGSLFCKSLKGLLTSEQTARSATLRLIEELGGQVTAESREATPFLEARLSGVVVADEDLAILTDLQNLQALDLASTRVTDAGLAHLQALTKLQRLNLTGTAVTDAGLARLSQLTNLQRLDLFDTQVTDEGVRNLRKLTKLTELNLSGTLITDAGLAHVERLSNLKWINLYNTRVTDRGVVHLRALTNLEWLDVGKSQVTDEGIASLKGLAKLRWLNLSSTQVTTGGLAELKDALPFADIWKRSLSSSD